MPEDIRQQARDLMTRHIALTGLIRNPKQAAWHSRQANIWGKLCR